MKLEFKHPIVIGITGATGVIYGVKILKTLNELGIKTILIISDMGILNARQELGMSLKDLTSLANESYSNRDMEAPIASGSFLTSGMIVAPCSVKSLSGIANCYDDTLITRAADVTIKERRKLILLFRETPLHMGYIKLMEKVTCSGGIVMPPVPAFYNNPKTIDDVVNHTINRCLDLMGISINNKQRWGNT